MIPWHAIIRLQGLLLGLALVAIGYGLFIKRLATVVQPIRLRLAERGEKYLAVCKDPKEQGVITFYLDNALSPWVCIWTSALLPIILICQLIRPVSHKIIKEDEEEYHRLAALFTISTFSANPLFGSIILIELAIVTILVIIFSGKLTILLRVAITLIERLATRRPQHHHVPVH
jgi:hypothetical protein